MAPDNGAEVRSPASAVWITTVCALLLAAGAVAFAVWDASREPPGKSLWLTSGLAALFSLGGLYAALAVRMNRTRLHHDRVERKGLFGTRRIGRADVAGFRVQQNGLIRLVRRDDRRRDLTVTGEVVLDPAWTAWLESLPDLDARDAEARRAALEADPRLGDSPEQRRRAFALFRRGGGWLTGAAFALGLWAIFWPRPYELAIAANAVAPLAALAIAWRWRGLVSLAQEDRAGLRIDVSALWLMPSLALALRAFNDVEVLDWRPALAVSAALAAPLWLLLLRLDRQARVWWMALFTAGVLVGWSWGLVTLANAILDRGPPELARASVVGRSGEADDDPALTVRTKAPRPMLIENIDVSGQRFAASAPGSEVCVAIHPGRFGWRYVYVVDCPPA